jgi:hypothetical protein
MISFSRSLPIILNADELSSAKNEELVTMRSMQVSPAKVTPPISAVPNRSISPSTSRPRMDSTVLLYDHHDQDLLHSPSSPNTISPMGTSKLAPRIAGREGEREFSGLNEGEYGYWNIYFSKKNGFG